MRHGGGERADLIRVDVGLRNRLGGHSEVVLKKKKKDNEGSVHE